MKKTSPTIELRLSLTENARESPEEELKCISSNHSFEGIHQKLMATTSRGDWFTLNGWEQSRERSARSYSKGSKAKHASLGTSCVSSTLSKVLKPDRKHSNFLTLQPRSGKNIADLNFKCGGGNRVVVHSSKGQVAAKPKVQCQSLKFKQQLSKEKMGLLHFYQNERVKRRLMMELTEPHRSINIIEYPMEMGRSPAAKGRRKGAAYRRYFN